MAAKSEGTSHAKVTLNTQEHLYLFTISPHLFLIKKKLSPIGHAAGLSSGTIRIFLTYVSLCFQCTDRVSHILSTQMKPHDSFL